MDNADKLLWKYMIENATLGFWEFYACGPREDPKARKSFNKVYAPDNIDWDKTRPVQDDTENSFLGTFADDVEYTAVYKGTLVMKTGERFSFITEADGRGLARIMADYLPDPFEAQNED